MKKIIVLIFLAFTILGAKEEAMQITVGSEKFSIPTPDNFIEISKLAPQIVDAYKTTLGYKANIRGYYFIKSDFEKLTKNENAKTKERRAVIYTPTAYENMNISQKQFKEIVDSTLKKLNIDVKKNDLTKPNQTIETIQKKMSIATNEAIKKVKTNGASVLGISFENENSLGYTMLLKYEDESKKSYIQVMDVGMMFINGKVLVSSFATAYEKESDISWVRQESKTWVDKIITINANKPTKQRLFSTYTYDEPATRPSSLEMDEKERKELNEFISKGGFTGSPKTTSELIDKQKAQWKKNAEIEETRKKEVSGVSTFSRSSEGVD
ncbi:hypothetical protein [Sulfurospirillum deleyianum]|uniref:Uncharacterized protein n=1 Tax=Sulfurospirillum deleyianum (strain ATCC 51133 / DSM 6946 / 5175) TaxID=525898 RepID=D1AZM7_SULD5|nr:hypothetical protein [Sulfurospirillum deleyianum]ACZ11494.1 hypothetical protein Sdel_0457 [Sulfurospirillum deleyianum DSM 6946]